MNNDNEFFESMVNNWTNGNISDYRKQLERLSKVELLEYIKYACLYGYAQHRVINKIIALLDN